jgi:hypothetical protein
MFWTLCAWYAQSALPVLRLCVYVLQLALRWTIVPMLDGVTFGDFSAAAPCWRCQTSVECACALCLRTATQLWVVCLMVQFWHYVLTEKREAPAIAA